MINISRIEELTSFAAHLGERVSINRLRNIAVETVNTDAAYAGCEKYVFSGTLFEDSTRYSVQFQAINTLINYWKTQGISLYVYMFLSDGIFYGGHVHKEQHSCRGSPGYEQETSFQEIQLVRIILDYITEEGSKPADAGGERLPLRSRK